VNSQHTKRPNVKVNRLDEALAGAPTAARPPRRIVKHLVPLPQGIEEGLVAIMREPSSEETIEMFENGRGEKGKSPLRAQLDIAKRCFLGLKLADLSVEEVKDEGGDTVEQKLVIGEAHEAPEGFRVEDYGSTADLFESLPSRGQMALGMWVLNISAPDNDELERLFRANTRI